MSIYRRESLKILHAKADRYMDDRTRPHARKGLAVSCKRGCNWCCHGVAASTYLVEALGIVDEVLNKDDGARQMLALIPTFLEQATELAKPWMRISLWAEKRQACGLLVEGECSVYAVRPAICRALVSFSPAELCATPGLDFLTMSKEWVEYLGPNYEEALLDRRIPNSAGPLPFMMLVALLLRMEGADRFLRRIARTVLVDATLSMLPWTHLEGDGPPPADFKSVHRKLLLAAKQQQMSVKVLSVLPRDLSFWRDLLDETHTARTAVSQDRGTMASGIYGTL